MYEQEALFLRVVCLCVHVYVHVGGGILQPACRRLAIYDFVLVLLYCWLGIWPVAACSANPKASRLGVYF